MSYARQTFVSALGGVAREARGDQREDTSGEKGDEMRKVRFVGIAEGEEVREAGNDVVDGDEDAEDADDDEYRGESGTAHRMRPFR